MMLSACSDNDSLDVRAFYRYHSRKPVRSSSCPAILWNHTLRWARVGHGEGVGDGSNVGRVVGIGFAFTFNGYVRLPENELIT